MVILDENKSKNTFVRVGELKFSLALSSNYQLCRFSSK